MLNAFGRSEKGLKRESPIPRGGRAVPLRVSFSPMDRPRADPAGNHQMLAVTVDVLSLTYQLPSIDCNPM